MIKFTKIPLNLDPLRGFAGLSWYERNPAGLLPGEWKALDEAVDKGHVSAVEYFEWKYNVKGVQL